MTCENTSVTRSNFASRLLNKAIAERTKTGEIKKPTVADAEKYAVPTESKEVAAVKS
jgi:hypothetical protein